jgi:hypothetical protein
MLHILSGGDLYFSAATWGHSLCGLIQRTTPFSHLLQHAWVQGSFSISNTRRSILVEFYHKIHLGPGRKLNLADLMLAVHHDKKF